MCGSQRSTISPSSSSTSRSTPCAAGCCGPKLMLKLRIRCSPGSVSWPLPSMPQAPFFSSPGRMYSAPSQGLMKSNSRYSWVSFTGS